MLFSNMRNFKRISLLVSPLIVAFFYSAMFQAYVCHYIFLKAYCWIKTKIPDDYFDFATREAMAQFRMKLAGDLHEYYTNRMQMENYAARLMKITGLVQAIQKSHAERKKIMEITKLFDLFKIDLCEQETIIK